jgi:hypothetical protein
MSCGYNYDAEAYDECGGKSRCHCPDMSGWRLVVQSEGRRREDAWMRYRRTRRAQAIMSAVLVAIAVAGVMLATVG